MSLVSYVCPISIKTVEWSSIRSAWQMALGLHSVEILGNQPNLVRLFPKPEIMAPDEFKLFDPVETKLEFLDDLYTFKTKAESKISLSTKSNSIHEGIDEYELIYTYGYNLNSEAIEDITHQWKTVGYYFRIESFPIQNEHRLMLIHTLTLAIAQVCNGYIVFAGPSDLLETGVYTAKEFGSFTY